MRIVISGKKAIEEIEDINFLSIVMRNQEG